MTVYFIPSHLFNPFPWKPGPHIQCPSALQTALETQTLPLHNSGIII